MKHIGTLSRLSWLFLLVFLFSVSSVHSQGPLTDVSDLKREVNDLKAEIQRLTTMVSQMRQVMLESATVPPVKKETNAPPTEQKTVNKESPADEAEMTKVICRSVGTFFSEAEAALRLTDPAAAQDGMNRALKKMTSKLHGYRGTHRVTKLVKIYEGLAWDTFAAVQLSRSVQGNTAFLAKLQQHKQKYLETCPKK